METEGPRDLDIYDLHILGKFAFIWTLWGRKTLPRNLLLVNQSTNGKNMG